MINLLGWELPPGVDDIGLATLDISNFLEKLDTVLDATQEELDDEIAMLEKIGELIEAVNSLVQAIYTLSQTYPMIYRLLMIMSNEPAFILSCQEDYLIFWLSTISRTVCR